MNVYERIVELLKQEPILQDFKYVKSKYSFIKRVDGIRYDLCLDHQFFFNIEMSISPIASVRYEVLHKWHEKFNFKSIRDQRDNYTVGTSTIMVGYDHLYRFKYGGENFDEVYPKLREAIIKCMEYTFTTFSTMEDFYREKVLPILEEKESAPWCGDDWVFEYLTVCRILHPESYKKLKNVVMDHVNGLTKAEEPNIMEYKGKWGEILAYLESIDFSSGKAKLPKK
ncbi:MAG: hypothetical protein K2J78_02585 [Muribaculaceae bacterium]|nr:hypothetical protein [Muribaculaceae bacterium]